MGKHRRSAADDPARGGIKRFSSARTNFRMPKLAMSEVRRYFVFLLGMVAEGWSR